MLNSVGLQNPGIEHVIAHELPELQKYFYKKVIANISGFSEEEYVYCARRLDTQDCVGILEVNISCCLLYTSPVSAETAPHYLLFTEKDVRDSGDYKMNPPIRGEADRDALIEAVCDGTIDVIATDHAPHSYEEKSGGFQKSLNGIVGLETARCV